MSLAPAEAFFADIQKLIQQRDFNQALVELLAHLKTKPNDEEALYMSAVCYRYQKQYKHALSQLNQLKKIAPGHARAYQEEGHVYRVQGDLVRACDAYALAVQLNPALEASWREQLKIHIHTGAKQHALAIKSQLDHLLAQPKPLIAVMDLISQGKLLKAEALCKKFLLTNPTHVEGMRLLADIAVKLSVLDEAEFLLEKASEFEPENIQVKIDHIQVLNKRQKFEKALEKSSDLVSKDANNLQFKSLHAIELMQTGSYEEAISLFDEILEKAPKDPLTLTSKGHALKTYGKQSDAISSYKQALEQLPEHGEAWYSLANLKTFKFDDVDIETMLRQETSPRLSPNAKPYLSFALGKAYEDKKEFDQAFHYYELGNLQKQRQSRYTTDSMLKEFKALKEQCSSELFQKHKGAGHQDPAPIFIVGLPRAGSTLLEQILSSHPDVDGTLELPNILSLTQKLRHRKTEGENTYPASLKDLSTDTFKQFGEEYIQDTRIHRKQALFFTDKMPNNFRHIGLIHLILPNAKIIDARRHPMACCFSGFKQLFAEGQEFSYGLEEIGHYYDGYLDLMRHWHKVLPEKVLHVQYEDVVEDLDTQVKRILDYCGLPFHQNCIDFHKTDRAVRTASSEQVRQPIFKSGLEQWKNFESHLEPLKTALGDSLHNYES